MSRAVTTRNMIWHSCVGCRKRLKRTMRMLSRLKGVLLHSPYKIIGGGFSRFPTRWLRGITFNMPSCLRAAAVVRKDMTSLIRGRLVNTSGRGKGMHMRSGRGQLTFLTEMLHRLPAHSMRYLSRRVSPCHFSPHRFIRRFCYSQRAHLASHSLHLDLAKVRRIAVMAFRLY